MPEILQAPQGVKAELKRGLAWNEAGHGGDGLKPETVAWARRLANDEPITREKAVDMRAWLARHEVDKQGEGFRPGEPGYPSPGRVAWALWGGDPAVTWSDRVVKHFENEDSMSKVRKNWNRIYSAMEQMYDPPDLPTPCTPADLTEAMRATMPAEMQAEFCARWNLVVSPLPTGLGLDDDAAFGFVMSMLCMESGWERRPDGSYARITVETEGAVIPEEVEKAGRMLSAANRAKVQAAIDTLTALLAEAEPADTTKGTPVGVSFAIVSKSGDEKMQAFGYAYVSKGPDGKVVVDHSGEVIDPAELERAVYASIGKTIGRDNHEGGKVATIIESAYLNHDKLAKMGVDPKGAPDGAWWVGFQVHDAEMWKAIKEGKACLSIGGSAKKEPI